VLRIIEEEAMKDKTGKVLVQLPVDVATFLLNEKRTILGALEARNGIEVILIPNRRLETPHYELQRLRTDEEEPADTSYRMAGEDLGPSKAEALLTAERPKAEEPLVKGVSPATPAPTRPAAEPKAAGQASAPAPAPATGEVGQPPGLLGWLKRIVVGSGEPAETPNNAPTRSSSQGSENAGTSTESSGGTGSGRSGGGRRRRSGGGSSRSSGARRSRPNNSAEADQKPAAAESEAKSGVQTDAETAAETPDASDNNDTANSGSTGTGRSRRGRRGGRRRRRGGANGQATDATESTESTESTDAGESSESTPAGTEAQPSAEGPTDDAPSGEEKPKPRRRSRSSTARKKNESTELPAEPETPPASTEGSVDASDSEVAAPKTKAKPKAKPKAKAKPTEPAADDPRRWSGRPRIPAEDS